MTFSIVARCRETGMFGVAVASSSPAVAARCAYARAGVGAVASQNVTDPTLGPRALDLMEKGAAAAEAVAIIARTAPFADHRQVLAVDAAGGTGVHTGAVALGVFADARDTDVACGGNLLASPDVPRRMVETFAGTGGGLGDRLIAAMRAGLDTGGEAGPIHSAGLRLVREVPWPVADLRVDWTEGDPIAELAALWALYAPQLDAYVTRALDPTAAPSYGVPGDE
jgi:uncharacterized Ntn-hydrolase superfamily protein